MTSMPPPQQHPQDAESTRPLATPKTEAVPSAESSAATGAAAGAAAGAAPGAASGANSGWMTWVPAPDSTADRHTTASEGLSEPAPPPASESSPTSSPPPSSAWRPPEGQAWSPPPVPPAAPQITYLPPPRGPNWGLVFTGLLFVLVAIAVVANQVTGFLLSDLTTLGPTVLVVGGLVCALVGVVGILSRRRR
jgi:hypothetical protein